MLQALKGQIFHGSVLSVTLALEQGVFPTLDSRGSVRPGCFQDAPDALGWEHCSCEEPRRALSLCQIDLRDQKKVTGIITQGARDFGHIQYVAAYKVAYSDNGTSWTLYRDGQTNSTKVCGTGQGGQ